MAARLAVGLMSGTSLDGIDAALVRIYDDDRFELVEFLTQPYTPAQRAWLLSLCDPATSHVEAICRANMELGELFAQAVFAVAERAGMALHQIDLIGSHGQTIYHIPGRATLQIGEPAVIANRTGVVTVGDFRPADIALGGQGAPLIPYFDQIAFRHLAPAAVQNIGGIGNVTLVLEEGAVAPVLGFDTGPGNMVIDAVVEMITEGQESFDRDGQIAARGRVDQRLLARLLSHPYFHQAPPKTTGRELFGREFARELVASSGLSGEDLVATVTAFTAHSIAQQYERFIFPHAAPQLVIVGGGGSYNPTLMWMLQDLLPIPVLTHEAVGLPGKAKEAVAFAFLAKAALERRTNNVPGATGGRPGVLGKICYPPSDGHREAVPS